MGQPEPYDRVSARHDALGQRGQILILTAVSILAMFGMTALTIDASFMYDKRNRLYAAADSAAKSVAIEIWRDPTIGAANMNAFANEQLNAHGFGSWCGVSSQCAVNRPPTSGPFTGFPLYVEVIVSEPTSTFFGKLLGWVSGNPGARAVAGWYAGPDCIITFDHISFTNPAAGSTLTMPNCGIVVGPESSWVSTDFYNRANINAKHVGVVHDGTQGCQGDCTYLSPEGMKNFIYKVPAPTDPLEKLPPLADPISGTPPCTAQYDIVASQTISVSDYDKYYCGWKFTGTASYKVTLNPGNYYINGPITDTVGGTNVTIVGTGVMLYLTAGNGRVQLSNSNFVSLGDFTTGEKLSAATSGTYNGILLYQDRGAEADNHLIFGKNNTDLYVEGAMYARQGTFVMKNENSHLMTNPCTLIIAYGIEVDKPQFVLDNTCLNFGGSPLLSLALGE